MDIRAARIAAGMTQSDLARTAHVSQPNLSAYENGRRVPSADVLNRITRALRVRPSERLRHNREKIRSIVAEYKATDPRVFGSVARGDDQPGSDLDLIVNFTDDATLLDEVGLRLALTDLLGVEVDIIAADTLLGSFRERAEIEAVPV
ncbi:MAG: helix-turn-helix domain-containing protein [Cumulibacter sp.]